MTRGAIDMRRVQDDDLVKLLFCKYVNDLPSELHELFITYQEAK